MTAPVRWLAGIAAAGVLLVLYTHRLGEVPAYLNLDEAHFGNHAYSLATTGHDLNGNRWPLFISLEDPLGDRPELPWGTTWYHPAGFYAIASILTVAPFAEWSIRLPMALIGILNIVLVYLVAQRFYRDRRVAACAAALLALTPAHFILSRLALDYILPVPFVLGWMLALSHLIERRDARIAVVTGGILGLGCYSYVSSWLMMPLFLLITAVIVVRTVRRPELLVPLGAGFAIALLPLIWILWHPAMPGNIIAQYQAGETRRSVLSAVVSGTGIADALRDAVGAYWRYFDPSFVFVSGGVSRLVSTGTIGVWPAGIGVLLLLAVARMFRTGATPGEKVIVAVLLAAPIPAALKGEPYAIQRAVLLLPCAALLAAGAMAYALERRGALVLGATVLALASVLLQFNGFAQYYFGEYRLRSAHALDQTAFRDTADTLIASADRAPAIWITAPLYDVSAKWRFYCTRAGRTDLLTRTRYFNGRLADASTASSGSLVVVEAHEAATVPSGWILVNKPVDITGESPLAVLQRQ